MMWRRALLTATTVLVAGCGSQHSPSNAGVGRAQQTTARSVAAGHGNNSTGATEPSIDPARLLVFFKRALGFDPVASQLTVDKDGRAEALITLGGPQGQHKQVFTLPPTQLHRLRSLLRRSRLRNSTCCNSAFYIYWISVAAHSWRLQQRYVPRSARGLIDELNAITDSHTGFRSPRKRIG